MRTVRNLVAWSSLVVALAFLASCSTDAQKERYPQLGVYEAGSTGTDDIGTTTSGYCEQNCGETLAGTAFRFTLLHVIEPADEVSPAASVVRDVINDSWSSDILTHVLNLIIETEQPDYASGLLGFHAGPAWFQLTDEAAQAPPGLGNVQDCDIESFCLLEDLDGRAMDVTMSAPIDENCGFEIDLAADDGEGEFLMFHTGPTNDPVLCAPEQGLTEGLVNNTIPLSISYVRGRFDEGCGNIVDGYLEGCIAIEHANRICICTDGDYNCYADPDPAGSTYCEVNCGARRFLNFGGLVTDVARIPATCKVLGLDGIRIVAQFEAARLGPERFQPERSIDCSN